MLLTYPLASCQPQLRSPGWDGWCLTEESKKVPDVGQALSEQRRLWEKLVAASQLHRPLGTNHNLKSTER